MVGDIKQSIYGFRYSNPKNFIERKNVSNLITLNKNFRSKENILAFINFIFEGLFSEDMCDMSYGPDEFIKKDADGKYVTFESSKFSTFALGYKDKKDVPPGGNGGTNNEKPTLPEAVEKIANTLDNTPIAATMMLVCSSGLCLFAVARKRKEIE